jgi:hypothetical protein
LFLKSLGVNNASGSAKSPPLGAAVMGRSIHTVQDLELAKAYHLHTHAAFQAASASINEALRDYAVTAGEHPDSYAAHRAEKPDAKKIDAGRFSLTSEQPKVTVPDVPLKPDELLSRPELTAGADGYTYRLFGHRLDFVGPMSLSFNLPDGTDVELTLAPIGPPGVIKTD